MHLTMRLDDELGDAATAAAAASGMPRSRWIALLIERELGAAPSVPSRIPSPTTPRSKLTIRIDTETLTRIDALAADLRMRRNQWILQSIRARVWDTNGGLADYPISADAADKLIEQVVRIGRNVNQAAHAINAAAMPGSELNLAQTTEHMLQMQQDIEALARETKRQLVEFAWKENRYWRGSARRGI